MLREFYDSHVCQRTKDGFFSATEFLKRFNELAGKEIRLQDFFDNKGTKEFLNALDIELLPNSANERELQTISKTHETSRGKHGETWARSNE